jgi:integrase
MRRPIPSSEQCIAIASLDDRPDADLYNAAFSLLYGCGVFNGEVLNIRRRDVLISERMRLSITGSKKRMLPVPKGAADRVLLAMNRGSGHSDDDFLFFRRGRLCQLGWVLTQRSNVLGLARPLTTTDLRLACAVHMMDAQTPLELVAAMMGYRDPNKLRMALTGSFF